MTPAELREARIHLGLILALAALGVLLLSQVH